MVILTLSAADFKLSSDWKLYLTKLKSRLSWSLLFSSSKFELFKKTGEFAAKSFRTSKSVKILWKLVSYCKPRSASPTWVLMGSVKDKPHLAFSKSFKIDWNSGTFEKALPIKSGKNWTTTSVFPSSKLPVNPIWCRLDPTMIKSPFV